MKNKDNSIYQITFRNIGPLDFRSQGLGPEPKTNELLKLSRIRERGEIKTICYEEDIGQSDVILITNFKIKVRKFGPNPRTQFEDILYLANDYFRKLDLYTGGFNEEEIEVKYLPPSEIRFESPSPRSVYGKFPFPLAETELKGYSNNLFEEFRLSISSYEKELARCTDLRQRELDRIKGIEKLCADKS